MISAVTAESDFWRNVFPAIAKRAAEKHPELRTCLTAYASEFQKFMGLLKSATAPVAMVSPRIDHLWHEFITCTVLYRNYCARFVGHYLDHMPRTDWNPVPENAVLNFFEAYEATHGAVPPCWFHGLSVEERRSLRSGTLLPAFRWSGYIPPGFEKQQN
jgi:hypothetical protein